MGIFKMVVKYQTCNFSEYKIAPGKGLRYCEVNGKQHNFISKKCRMLFLHHKKPLTIRWSLKWRTAHKKGKVEESKNRNNRNKKERTIKAVVGFSMEEIKDKKKKYLEKNRKAKGNVNQQINTKGGKGQV